MLHEGLLQTAADRFSLVELLLHAQDGKASVMRSNDLHPGAEALRIRKDEVSPGNISWLHHIEEGKAFSCLLFLPFFFFFLCYAMRVTYSKIFI